VRSAFVTQWFPPEPGTVIAPAMVDSRVSHGHEAYVVSTYPSMPSGRRARPEEVTVNRAALNPSYGFSSNREMANYRAYAVAPSWTPRTRLLAKATVQGWDVGADDVVIHTVPSATTVHRFSAR
jgi:colanic acid biosynthesis glycosyl transferase WcaI